MDFTKFDPNSGGRTPADKPNLPAGVYVMMAKMFKRRQKNGKESLMFVCVPLLADGKVIGRDSYAAVFENCTLTAEASFRLANLCQAVGQTTPFNANSDAQVKGIFIWKPFKCHVVEDRFNGQVSMKIKEYLPMSKGEKAHADIAIEDWQMDGDGGYQGGSYRPQSEPMDDNIPPSTDDDIPF